MISSRPLLLSGKHITTRAGASFGRAVRRLVDHVKGGDNGFVGQVFEIDGLHDPTSFWFILPNHPYRQSFAKLDPEEHRQGGASQDASFLSAVSTTKTI